MPGDRGVNVAGHDREPDRGNPAERETEEPRARSLKHRKVAGKEPDGEPDRDRPEGEERPSDR